jgi:hypothetical protein
LTTLDPNLSAANFPTTLTGQSTVSSDGGGAGWSFLLTSTIGTGGTGAGNGGKSEGNGGSPPTVSVDATASTMYGAGGGAGPNPGYGGTSQNGTAGFQGLVIVRYLTGTVTASGGQETVLAPV